MFGKHPKDTVRERTYGEVLESAIEVFGSQIGTILKSNSDVVGVAGFIKEVSSLKFDILDPHNSHATQTACVQQLSALGLRGGFEAVVDKVIGRTLQDQSELETLLRGITLSLRGDSRNQTALMQLMRKHPSLIFCRLLELCETDL